MPLPAAAPAEAGADLAIRGRTLTCPHDGSWEMETAEAAAYWAARPEWFCGRWGHADSTG